MPEIEADAVAVAILDRNPLRYRSCRQEDAALGTRIREIAESKRRMAAPGSMFVYGERAGE